MAKQALDGKRLNSFGVDPSKLTIIGLDTEDGPEHPLYDERIKLPLDDAMVRNVMVHGVIEDVIVAKAGSRTLVVAGRQRVRWAREANKRLKKEGQALIAVPCKVRRGDDAGLLAVMVSENEIRRADTPLVRAKKAQKLLDLGRSDEDVAIHFGVTTAAVRSWLKLLELPATIRRAVDDGHVAASAAIRLHGLEREEAEAKLKELLNGAANGHGKVTERAVKAAANGDGRTAPGKRFIRKVANGLGSTSVAMVLGWVLGEVDDDEISGAIPAFGKVLDGLRAAPEVAEGDGQ